MFISRLPFVITLLVACCCAETATAGLFSGQFVNRIELPMLKAAYSSVDGEFAITGVASTVNLDGKITLSEFHLDANFDSSGLFNSKQKGSFYVKSGSVVLLKGTITEANGSVFSKEGKLEFLANMDIEGEFASLYQDQVGLRIDLSSSVQSLQEKGFAFVGGFIDQLGQGEIGRAVPEPSSLAVMASTFVLGLLPFRRRRRQVA